MNTTEPASNPAGETEKPKKEKKGPGKKALTLERMVLAQERTLLAWVRTAASFLTFGFAIYKLLDARIKETDYHPLLDVISPRQIGVTMFLTGLIGLLLATVRHIKSMTKLNKYLERQYFSLPLIQAYVVMLLIILMLVGAMIQA